MPLTRELAPMTFNEENLRNLARRASRLQPGPALDRVTDEIARVKALIERERAYARMEFK